MDKNLPDKLAMYPNGMQGVHKDILTNMIYPKALLSTGVQGTVIVKFVVEADGTVKKAEVLKGVDPILDMEAINAVRQLKRFVPAYKDGKPMQTSYTVPIEIRLN